MFVMNERDLQAFVITLPHHLNAERELFEAGLIDQPVQSQTPEPAKLATAEPIIVFVNTTAFDLQPVNRQEILVRVIGRVEKHKPPITVKGRHQRIWELNPRRRG